MVTASYSSQNTGIEHLRMDSMSVPKQLLALGFNMLKFAR